MMSIADAARQLIERLCDKAALHAAVKADDSMRAGDIRRELLWRRVLAATIRIPDYHRVSAAPTGIRLCHPVANGRGRNLRPLDLHAGEEVILHASSGGTHGWQSKAWTNSISDR
jgi:hypothetical protein